jgi:hypothetical protein
MHTTQQQGWPRHHAHPHEALQPQMRWSWLNGRPAQVRGSMRWRLRPAHAPPEASAPQSRRDKVWPAFRPALSDFRSGCPLSLLLTASRAAVRSKAASAPHSTPQQAASAPHSTPQQAAAPAPPHARVARGSSHPPRCPGPDRSGGRRPRRSDATQETAFGSTARPSHQVEPQSPMGQVPAEEATAAGTPPRARSPRHQETRALVEGQQPRGSRHWNARHGSMVQLLRR